jgi:hypothetical protein
MMAAVNESSGARIKGGRRETDEKDLNRVLLHLQIVVLINFFQMRFRREFSDVRTFGKAWNIIVLEGIEHPDHHNCKAQSLSM